MKPEELNRSILEKLQERGTNDFKETLSEILKYYLNGIDKIDDTEKIAIVGKTDFEKKWFAFRYKIKALCKTLNEVAEDYYNGELYKCANKIISRLEGDKNIPGILYQGLNTVEINAGDYLYRIRIKDEKRFFKAHELFHIPFEKRGIIKTQRYSIPGYPCLYLSTSVYGCWEEMRKPDLSAFYISLLTAQKNIKLLDLRLPENESVKSKSLLLTWPLIIACSIKVPDDNQSFKAEYIIPQFVLQVLIRNRQKHGFLGIKYTSTQRNNDFDFNENGLFDNIAIPVVSDQKKGLCSYLSDCFKITKPICYEHELIRHPSKIVFDDAIGEGGSGNSCFNTVSYEKSIFGILEKILNKLPALEIKPD